MAQSVHHDPHTNKLNNTQIVLTSLAAGAIAGALAKTTIAPLDRTKINFQIGHKPYSTRKALKFLLETFKKEGFFALWRGNSATMARIVPHAAIQFTAHEQWKRVLKVDQSGKTPGKLFLAGSLAGVTSQSLTYPLDLARARMAVTRKHEYATLRQVFVKIYYTEGLMTFYRGYIPTMSGVVIYAGVSFFTYDTLKRLFRGTFHMTKYCSQLHLPEKLENTNMIDINKIQKVVSVLIVFEVKSSNYVVERIDGKHSPPAIASLGFGAIAGLLGQSSSYPLDIVRRRMQTDSAGRYRGIFHTLVYVYRNEGIRKGFYKGLSMNWIKGPIAVGISYATYDNVKDFLRNVVVKYRNKLLYIE